MGEDFKKIVRQARGDDDPPDDAVADPEQPARIVPTPKLKDESLGDWFNRFHEANRHVYGWFVAMAREIRDQGHRRYGAKTIMERLRWESPVRYGTEFKMSNVAKDRCTARFARMLIAEDSSFSTFFETRRLTHDDWSE